MRYCLGCTLNKSDISTVCMCDIHIFSFPHFKVVYFLSCSCLKDYFHVSVEWQDASSLTHLELFCIHIIVTFLWAFIVKSIHWWHQEVTKQKNRQTDKHPYVCSPFLDLYAIFNSCRFRTHWKIQNIFGSGPLLCFISDVNICHDWN